MTYREFVKSTSRPHDNTLEQLLHGVMGLTGESGEVSEIVKKVKFHGKELNREALLKELSDVRWYFELLCEALDTDIQTIEAINMEKLSKRYPNGYSDASSASRKDEQ
jgi:NTP pyrophosphatase (non-canonical NTP hydrolase)